MFEHKTPEPPERPGAPRPRLRPAVTSSQASSAAQARTRPAQDARAQGGATVISHTVQPPKQHIHCYECKYEYNLTGRMKSTNCPKCRQVIDLSDHAIDNAFQGELKTLGKTTITPRASLNTATLVATDLELAGRITGSKVEVYRELTLQPGASFRRNEITAPDLKIVQGADVQFRNPAVYRHVDVSGAFTAQLYFTGRMILRAGSSFTGALHGGNLIVEDGATLRADIDLCPDGRQRAEDMNKNAASDIYATGGDEQVMVPQLPADELSAG
ncbi:MAG: hypothetical protein V2A34_01230 [Lentisphaerota bacterium]